MFKRKIFSSIYSSINTPRKFILILMGPRQIGKTTLIEQLAPALSCPLIFVSADDPLHQNRSWLETQWKQARSLLANGAPEIVLAIDEVQKIPQWSQIVKTYWDEDSRNKVNLKVILLGSSALRLKKDSSESLAGRFEKIALMQWSKQEMAEAFGFDFEDYLYFGGYPGAASLITDPIRWKKYIRDSIVESVLSVDILALQRVEKPALLKQLFFLACEYSGQILSYQKILGQLQESGNTATAAFYLDLLTAAGLVKGLQKWSFEKVRTRASSPKLNVMDIGFMTAVLDYSRDELKQNTELRGRVVESLVGTHLIHQADELNCEIFYWNDGHHEVDFIVKKGSKVMAIEVKSGRKSRSLNGLNVFLKKYPQCSSLVVGGGGIPLETFLTTPVTDWF